MSNNQYTNLTTTGLAFINRVRWVESQGDPYLSLTLNSWHGKDGKNKTRFEVIPKGDALLNILQDLAEDYPEVMQGNQSDDQVVVTCGFILGGSTPDSYTNKKGEEQYFIRANLIGLQWIKVKVNGQDQGYFYRKNEEEQVNADHSDNQENQDYQEEPETPEPPRRRQSSNNDQAAEQPPAPQRQQRQTAQPRNGQRGQNPQRQSARRSYSN